MPVLPSALVLTSERENLVPHFVRGAREWLWDESGKRYFDGTSGTTCVSNLGHGVSELSEVLSRQSQKLAIVPTQLGATRELEALADELGAFLGWNGCGVWTCCSGSEAIEAACKFAQQWQAAQGESNRKIILSLRGSYHGTTLGALSYGGHLARRAPFEPLPQESPRVESPHCAACPWGQEGSHSCQRECLQDLEAEILRQGPNHVAAILVETVLGATLGAVELPPRFLLDLKKLSQKYGILLIGDEVLCGMGRCGAPAGSILGGVWPDICAFGKGLGCGVYPVAALVVSPELYQSAQRAGFVFSNGHTYACNPLGAQVARTVLQILTRDKILDEVTKKSIQMRDILSAFSDFKIVKAVRGVGLMWAIEFAHPQRKDVLSSIAIRNAVHREALKLGLITFEGLPAEDGRRGAHLFFAPPFVTSPEGMEFFAQTLGEAINTVSSQGDFDL